MQNTGNVREKPESCNNGEIIKGEIGTRGHNQNKEKTEQENAVKHKREGLRVVGGE